jgi:tripartite-type tricarboxylate transporter receptor subunit TctC
MFCGPIGVALPQIKAGNVYALGVTGVEPSPLLPDVAPLADSYPGLIISAWYGLFAPAGTPASVINKLRDEFGMIFAEPELQPTRKQEAAETVEGDYAASVAQQMHDHQNKMADIYNKLDYELSEKWRQS